jgi:small-conductance mechanosensitive channel
MDTPSPSDPPWPHVSLRPFAVALLALAALVLVPALRTVVGSGAPAGPALPRPNGAVVIEGRTVVVFRASMLGYPPPERARSVEARIQGLIDARQVGPVTVSDAPEGKVVRIGDRVAFAVVPADVDGIAGETMEGVAEAAARTLEQALRDGTEGRSLGSLLLNAVYVAVATALYAVLLILLRHGTRWLRARISAFAESHSGQLANLGLRALPQALVQGSVWGVRVLAGLCAAAATYGWVAFSLSRFPYTRAVGETLAGFLVHVLETVALNLVGWLPGLVFVAVIFLVTHYLNRGARLFFEAVEAGTVRMPRAMVETAQPTRRLVSLGLWLFAIVQAYPYLPGSGTDAFKGISVFLGLLLSLGGSGVIGHATSGLVLMFSRALRPGDYIRVGEHEGTVIAMGTLSTKLRTPWLEEVNVPNLLLAGTTMTNYSRAARETGVVVHTSVTIGYDVPWRQVHELLERAAERTRGLRREPAPYVLQRALSDFYVEYELCASVIRPEDRVATLAALHANIQDCFNEQGVQIMSPHYFGDPAQPKVVPPERWTRPPAQAG